MSCNSAIHAICPLTLTTYKYIELQVSSIIQKLSCNVNCKTPFFLILKSHSQKKGKYKREKPL